MLHDILPLSKSLSDEEILNSISFAADQVAVFAVIETVGAVWSRVILFAKVLLILPHLSL